MGCLFAKPLPEEIGNKAIVEAKAGKYSWDTREKINPADYTIEEKKGETIGRMPGTVNGQQFIIQNCQDCNVYIFDHCNTVTVDDCSHCRIFLGPVKGSVFLRNCQDCKCVIACQQFRTRDCRKLELYLACATQPSIESSTHMKFGCFSYNYPELEGQFQNAGLSEFNNNWSSIYDFTPMDGESNWSLLAPLPTLPPEGQQATDTNAEIPTSVPPPSACLPEPDVSPLSDVKVSMCPDSSFVPHTVGLQQKVHDESCLVTFFSDGQSHQRAKSFIQSMKAVNTNCLLVSSKEVSLDASEGEAVFGTDSYVHVIGRGPLIGLEYNGPECIRTCQTTAMNIARETGSTGLVYVSSTASSATRQLDAFFKYASMSM